MVLPDTDSSTMYHNRKSPLTNDGGKKAPNPDHENTQWDKLPFDH